MANKRVVVVTGSGSGIGHGIALQLAKDGYAVISADLNLETAQKTADEITKAGHEAVAVQGDTSKKASHEKFVQTAVDHFGRLDTYVNNAGITEFQPVIDETEEDFDHIIGINLKGTLFGIQAAAKQFLKQDDGDQIRKIINASSIAGHVGFKLAGAYSATKFGVRGLTQTAAQELGDKHITVNAYCPGIVDTPMWDYIDERVRKINGGGEKGAYIKSFTDSITMKRLEQPADVANYVSYLASPKSDYMTGQAGLIDGGLQFI